MAQLRIGEVARLLGISTKTIRHYHKVGLLAEPSRTASAYRLYAAQDLVRLVRIRRLQRLGLSLTQIQRILAEPTSPELLHQALREIVIELDEEMGQLHARRERIMAILRRDGWEMDQPETVPAVLAHLPPPDSPAAAAIWAQDQRIFGTLESLTLPDGYQHQMTAMAERALSDPELYRQMYAMAEQLAALAEVPAESPLVEQLVARARAEGWAAQLDAIIPPDAPRDGANEIVPEIMLSLLAPAQRRFLRLLKHGEYST